MGYIDGASLYEYVRSRTTSSVDPTGQAAEEWDVTGGKQVPVTGSTIRLPNGDEGTVAVYVGVRITKGDAVRFDAIHFEFKTKDPKKQSCTNVHWIQFVRAYKTYKAGIAAPKHEGYPTGDGLERKYGEWHLDAFLAEGANAYYDSRGAANRSDTEISIFDQPALEEDDNIVEAVSEFHTYLIAEKSILYHVHWRRAHKRKDGNGPWEKPGYEILAAGPAKELFDPALAKQNKWLLGYNGRDPDTGELLGPVGLDNPLYVK